MGASKITERPKIAPEKYGCSRHHALKRDAERDARWMKNHGGIGVKITGRTGFWRVSGFLPACELAAFCTNEAFRESKKR